MHPIFLAAVVLTFVHFSIAGPIVRSVPETNEATFTTGRPFETTSFVSRYLQDRSNGFGDDALSIITLIPSLIYPEGTTGASFLVFNPEPTDHSSAAAAKQTHTSPSSTNTKSRLTAGIIRPLTDFTTKSTSTQSTKTHTNANPQTQTQTQTQSSTSRPVGTIVPFTKPDTDQTTSKTMTTPGPSLSTEPAFTTTPAMPPTTTREKTTTVHATSTTTATAMVTVTNPVTVSTTATTTTTKTRTQTVTKAMTRCSSSHSPTGVDVIPVHPTGLTTTATTSSSYSPTGVDVIPVDPTWLTTSSNSAPTTTTAATTNTSSNTESSSYSPTGVDVIPVHPTWATGV